MGKTHTQRYSQAEVTPQALFHGRRRIVSSLGLALGATFSASVFPLNSYAVCQSAAVFTKSKSNFLTPNSYQQISRYNNYYEFSTNKEAVHILAQELVTKPWTLTIDGEVKKPTILNVEQLINTLSIEERIYPLRCVEGWSMVIPWQGFSLCQLLNLVQPTSKARFVEFISLFRPEQMIGQRTGALSWPYTEALRLDEALHPLTIIATGMYGKSIPAQNGAPLRLVVPWKYGFKSAKAITHIRLTAEKPKTTWHMAAPTEYGFYGNVNPHVPHPRWSQQRENRIGELRKKPTLLFNGYVDDVANLYKDMDLSLNY